MASQKNEDAGRAQLMKKIGFSMSLSKSTRGVSDKQASNVLGNEKNDEILSKSHKKGPLVIPLKRYDDDIKGRLAVEENHEDEAAAKALLKDGSRTQKERSKNASDETNFSAQGSLVIGHDVVDIKSKRLPLLLAAKQRFMSSNKLTGATESMASNELHQDLSLRASDLQTDSDSYSKVPISEFGAAMLRGMGWKGDQNEKKEEIKDPFEIKPRHHRLGLGATKKPKLDTNSATSSTRHWAKKPGSSAYERVQEDKIEENTWKAKVDEARRQQQTIQDGSIIRLRNFDGDINKKSSRGVVVKYNGVPGLNRVLIRLENRYEDEIVKKSDLSLVSRSELNDNPFRENHPHAESHNDKAHNELKKHKIIKDHSRSRKRSRSSSRDQEYKKSKKDDQKSWLLPQIRVRVITKKACSGRQYKQKGIILDIIRSGVAVVQMADGEVFESKDSWLETALPKLGGNVVVLVGRYRLEKGKLLERQSVKGRAIVQLYDDLQIIKISLDDIAEWCAPLDTDMDD